MPKLIRQLKANTRVSNSFLFDPKLGKQVGGVKVVLGMNTKVLNLV